jgi:hypothetical protein
LQQQQQQEAASSGRNQNTIYYSFPEEIILLLDLIKCGGNLQKNCQPIMIITKIWSLMEQENYPQLMYTSARGAGVQIFR